MIMQVCGAERILRSPRLRQVSGGTNKANTQTDHMPFCEALVDKLSLVGRVVVGAHLALTAGQGSLFGVGGVQRFDVDGHLRGRPGLDDRILDLMAEIVGGGHRAGR